MRCNSGLTLSLGGNTLTLQSGGIMLNGGSTISNGSLTTSNGRNLWIGSVSNMTIKPISPAAAG